MVDPATIESRLREFFAARAEGEGIAAAYLFGSVARGTAGPDSDVDVGVLYSGEPPQGLDRFRLEGEIQEVLDLPVQVVTLDTAPTDLVHRILPGKLLIDRDRSRRIRFEVRTREEYWDLLPLLRICRRMTRSLEEGG